MMLKLWGDNFFDAPAKKWRTDGETEDGKPIRRAFAQFIMDPICKLCQAIIDGNQDQYMKMLKTLDLELSQDDKKLYFVLEYCPGGELFGLLSVKDKLTE